MDSSKINGCLYPSLGCDELYKGDDIPDIDSRYVRDDVIDVPESRSSCIDIFKLLATEVDSPKYKIRTPEQQASWAKKSTDNKRKMGQHILCFAHIREALIEDCMKEKAISLFSEMKTIDGEVRVCGNKKLNKKVATMLLSLGEDPSMSDIEKMMFKIVVQYNLSYSKFIKPHTLALMSEYKNLKSIYEKYNSSHEVGENIDIFSEDEKLPIEIKDAEEAYRVSWPGISSIMRNVGLLYLSSESLKERLVCTNLRSCFNTAMKHYHLVGGAKNVNFDEKDLVSEAATGLMHAADLYIHGTSARFTTYAENWVKLKVTRYSKNNNTVRIPVHVTDLVQSIIKVLRTFEKKPSNQGTSNSPVSQVEVSEILGKEINDKIWEQALNRYNGRPISLSCLTTSMMEENEVNFDSLVIAYDQQLDQQSNLSESAQDDIDMILSTAKSMVEGVQVEGRKKVIKIEPEQYEFLKKRYLEDMSFFEISESYSGRYSEKSIRADLAKVISKIKIVLRV